ncbi:MAG: alpha/beta hydrolase [Promethearchaeia archaeon]|nr:MAG: alpha/beta hydrolase [Candidatus Lokiarchaeia archaeon]
MKPEKILFLHGYESSGKGFKAEFLRQIFSKIQTPTLTGDLSARMEQILPLFLEHERWVIIGSSYGGLMATLLAQKYPSRISRLVLLAPALIPPLFTPDPSLSPIDIPTDIFHGLNDDVVPLETVKPIVKKIFSNLEYHIVDDDHRLHSTTRQIPWENLLVNNTINQG